MTTQTAAPDPAALLRSRSYVVLLVFGAAIGAPVAAVAYFFLKAVAASQHFVFTSFPRDVGFAGEPAWWPIWPLVLSGVLVALAIRMLPGTGGHAPADGFKAEPTAPIELPGVFAAAFATLVLGAVLGPEAPLIAIGSGLGILAVRSIKRDAPERAATVIGVAGSFAAISTLLGSPIAGAFLLMETAGLGGALLQVVLVPGLVAAGIGTLIFVGLDAWTGFGTFALAVPDIPHFDAPTGAEFLWAIAIGFAFAFLGSAIRRGAQILETVVAPRRLALTPVVGLGVAGAAIVFAQSTGRGSSIVLFSGQSALPALIHNAAGWTVGALLLLVACKGVAYSLSLSSFRGGPVFPGMFIGGAAGIALSHLPGLPMIAGVGIGIGAMTVAMLGMPLTSVLLVTLFLQADGLALMPLVIVAVAVSYVVSARLAPATGSTSAASVAPTGATDARPSEPALEEPAVPAPVGTATSVD